MKKKASAYLKDNTLIIETRGYTEQEFSVSAHQVCFLEANAAPQEIGIAVIKALENFQTGIPHPSDSAAWRVRQKELCKIMEIKSWKTFAKDAKSIDITTENELTTIKVTPCKNQSPKEGFEQITEKSRTCPGEAESLGKTILEAFEDCE